MGVAVKAVQDSDGRIVDFLYQDINRLGAGLHGLQREDLLRRVASPRPSRKLARSGIFDLYVHCVDTGKPLIPG